MKKKYLTGAAAIFLAVMTAACSSGSSGGAGTTAAAKETAAEKETAVPETDMPEAEAPEADTSDKKAPGVKSMPIAGEKMKPSAQGSGPEAGQDAGQERTVMDYVGAWDAEGGRWGLEVLASGADEVQINDSGSISADEYSVMEAVGKLENGVIRFSDAVRTDFKLSETGNETVTAKYVGGYGLLELVGPSFDFRSVDDPQMSVLVPAGEEFGSASRYLLYSSINGPQEAVSDGSAGMTGMYADETAQHYNWEEMSNDEIGQVLLDAKLTADGFLMPFSDRELIPEDLLHRLSDDDLRLIVNEIYARRGRRFNSKDLQEYFDGKSWYKGTVAPEAFDESVFNSFEKANADLIAGIQNERKDNGSDAVSDGIVYYYQYSEYAGGSKSYENLEPVTIRPNGDGTAEFISQYSRGTLYAEETPDTFSGWVDEEYITASKHGLSIEYGDGAAFFER